MKQAIIQQRLRELSNKTAQKRSLLSAVKPKKTEVIENSHYKDLEYEVCENLMRGDN